MDLRRSLVLGFGTLLCLLLLGIAALNTVPIWLVADVVVAEPDISTVYYDADGRWSEAQTLTQSLEPGMNRVTLRLPTLDAGDRVRFDPGKTQGIYHILSLRWFRGGLSRNIALSTVENPRPEAMDTRLAGNLLELTTRDIDPQLIVPLPSLGWRLAGLLWPLGLVVLALLAGWSAALRGRIGAIGIANVFLGTAVALYCLMFAKFSPQLPIFDDWRYVIPSPFDLIGNRWDWLRAVGNDTYFLTGQAIDFVALKLSNVDFGWLRAVALALLLVYVWATQRVLVRTAISPLATAVGIALLAWTLSANSYWGGTAIAHHQFLPVLFGALVLLHLVGREGATRTRWSHALVVLLAVASGLAYISGGLFIIALAVALILAHADESRYRPWPPALHVGMWLLALGILLIALQIGLVGKSQGTLLDHTHASASVYPADHRFWLFVNGLFGRALGYTGHRPLLDAALAVLALAPAVMLGIQRAWKGFAHREPCERRMPVMLTIYAGVATVFYASAVAFGRAGLVAADASTEAIVWTAKARFHYWPIAAMLPFLWLGWAEIAYRKHRQGTILAAIAAFLMLVPKSYSPWDWVTSFRAIDNFAVRGAHCIATQFADDPNHVVCESITGPPINLAETMKRLRDDDRALYRQIERYLELPPPP